MQWSGYERSNIVDARSTRIAPPVRCHNCCTKNVSMNIQAMYNLIDHKNLSGILIQKLAHSTTRVSEHMKREDSGNKPCMFSEHAKRSPHAGLTSPAETNLHWTCGMCVAAETAHGLVAFYVTSQGSSAWKHCVAEVRRKDS